MAALSYVFDVTAATFQAEVAERSVDVPVLLDFWADWCGPCKTFAPILEALAAEYGGAFLVGKVDAEQEVELSQAFQVQNIPFVVLVSGGRPVEARAGALPEEEVRAILAKHGIEPVAGGEGSEPEPEDPDSPAVRFREARGAASLGQTAAARAALEAVPEDEVELATERANLAEGLLFLEVEFNQDSEAAVLMATARDQFLAGDHDATLQSVIASAKADRTFGDGLARRAILLVQAVLGDSDSVDEYRRQLATLLY